MHRHADPENEKKMVSRGSHRGERERRERRKSGKRGEREEREEREEKERRDEMRKRGEKGEEKEETEEKEKRNYLRRDDIRRVRRSGGCHGKLKQTVEAATEVSSEDWNHPRCWSEPSMYTAPPS